MTHTPGPWQAVAGSFRWNVTTVGPRTFNICALNPDRGDSEANARLIAAAPDLLAALKETLAVLEGFAPWESAIEREAAEAALTAIAKATA